jgi:hypothetical protein
MAADVLFGDDVVAAEGLQDFESYILDEGKDQAHKAGNFIVYRIKFL